MRIRPGYSSFLLVACILYAQNNSSLASDESSSVPKGPHWKLALSLNEFSILNVSEMDGLLKYGGSGDFNLSMAREQSNVVWNVTIDNPRLMELLNIFVGEKTIKLVQTLDPNNLDPNQKIALDAIKSLTQKLEYAREHPVWDSIRMSGTVVQEGTNWMLQTEDNSFRISGIKLEEVKSRSGKSIVADGLVKVPGEFEVSGFLDRQDNTLELFVMGLCPFGQKAEASLLTFLASTNNIAKPRLDVHYIFYKQQKDGKDVFTSLHGDAEVTEDLVQIAIRDHFPPAIFVKYLLLRAKSADSDWKQLAEQAGLTKSNVSSVDATIASDRDSLIRAEYDYTSSRYGITDGSPSYVWQSEKVADLKKIPAFKGLDAFTVETCSN